MLNKDEFELAKDLFMILYVDGTCSSVPWIRQLDMLMAKATDEQITEITWADRLEEAERIHAEAVRPNKAYVLTDDVLQIIADLRRRKTAEDS